MLTDRPSGSPHFQELERTESNSEIEPIPPTESPTPRASNESETMRKKEGNNSAGETSGAVRRRTSCFPARNGRIPVEGSDVYVRERERERERGKP
ncbi:hypothetical protein U1Q18_044430 [Sarracenia purpurea var. burkii]